ncbi:MAG: MinD/ParA family protein [Oscillospiraceae bacterium]|nr:MinD/ParA family protein [Oscillospiraceae bacterium]
MGQKGKVIGMNDQANKLREAIQNIKSEQQSKMRAEAISETPGDSRAGFIGKRITPAKVFTVTSGKGGVGKTNVTVNLAIALTEMGYRVALIDADFGLSNIEVLFGVMPKHSLFDVIHRDMGIMDVLCEGMMGIKLISGGSGIEELMRIDREHLPKVIANLSILDKEFDIILIDTGAGMSDVVISMALAADEVVLVTTPEPTSVTDAYTLVKTLLKKDKDKIIKIIINKADNPVEAIDALSRLIQVTGKFLDLKLLKLGYILNDSTVVKSVKQQQPFIVSYPKSQASKSIKTIAESLVSNAPGNDNVKSGGMAGFIKRVTRVFYFQH